MRRLVLLLSFAFLIPISEAKLALIKAPKRYQKLLSTPKFDFSPDHFSHPQFVVGYVDEKKLKLLPKEIEVLDSELWALGGYDRTDFTKRRIDRQKAYEGYHDYQALTQELTRIAAEYPNLVTLQTAGKSVQGRELWYVIVSQKMMPKETTPKFIYHANMHGDEVVGRELMIYLLRHLVEQYGKDSRITQILNFSQLFIMPSMNPDGFELRRRENANGKDLNRNFPDRFNSPSDTPNGRQIEVQHMMNLAKQHHFVYGINWHGGEICFNLPWGNIPNNKPQNKFGDDGFFFPIGREYTELNRPMYDNHHDSFDHGVTYGYEWYPVYGGIDDWFNWYRRSVHSVIELSTTKWPNSGTLATFWEQNREAMLLYLWRGLRGVHLEVRDPQGALVSQPTIDLHSSYPRRPLTFDSGYIHRLSGDGKQTITVSAPGFEKQTMEVDATYFDGSFTEVNLRLFSTQPISTSRSQKYPRYK